MTTRALVVLLALVPALLGAGQPRSYESQVVELAITYQRYLPRRPWAKSQPRTRAAMAVVVAGRRLLTSAQMVGDATLVRAEKFGGSARVPGRVVHVDPEINLALVEVDDPTFFDDLTPVRLAEALPTEGAVRSVRWKEGQLEVSASRVARIEVRASHTGDLEHAFLRLKSDLAGGGWVEPVFSDGLLVGLTLSQSNDLANVMPPELIAAYLAAASSPAGYPGFGKLGIAWQANRDPAQARYLGQQGPPRGVLVLGTPWGSSACGALEPRDLLLELDGHPIDPEGFYEHPRYGRLRFTNIAVDRHLAGETLPARVLRGGRERETALTLRPYPTALRRVPGRRSDEAPPYLVAGGLVFRELDADYLAAWGRDWQEKADTRLVTEWELYGENQTDADRRVLILAYVLPTPYNIGYHDLSNLIVEEVNGRRVDSIGALDRSFQEWGGAFHRVGFQPNQTRDQVVLDATGFAAATAEVLETYGIPARLRLPAHDLQQPEPPCPASD